MKKGLKYYYKLNSKGNPILGSNRAGTYVPPGFVEITLVNATCTCTVPGVLSSSGNYWIQTDKDGFPIAGSLRLGRGKQGSFNWQQINLGPCCQSYTVTLLPKTNLGGGVAGATIDSYPIGMYDVKGNFIGVAYDQAQFITRWNNATENKKVGSIIAGNTEFEFLGTSNIDITFLHSKFADEVLLQNFNNAIVPSFPVGLFSTIGTFTSNQATKADLINTLNASGIYNTAVTWVDGNDPFKVIALKQLDATVPTPFRVRRYWYIDVSPALTGSIYTSGTAVIRKADNTQVTASSGTLGTYGNFGLNLSTYGFGYSGANIPTVDTSSVYYINTLTPGTNYIYHDEDGEWAWCDVFGKFANNGGNLPPTIRHLAVQSFGVDNNTVNLSIGNFSNLSSCSALEAISFNGSGIMYDGTWMNYFPNLKTYQHFDRSVSDVTLPGLGLTKTILPNLELLTYRRSTVGCTLSSDPAHWLNLPPLTKGIDLAATGIIPVNTGIDTILNSLVTNLGSAVAYSTARIFVEAQNSTRTSAGDAAVTTLTSKGFTEL